MIKNFKNHIIRQNGFTLVELVVSMALLLILLGSFAGYYIDNLRNFNRSDELSRIQFDVRMASDFITSELRNIDSVSFIDNNGGSLNSFIALNTIQINYTNVNKIDFEIVTADDTAVNASYLMRVTVTSGSIGTQNYYELKTDILMNNIKVEPTGLNTISQYVYYHKKTT